MSVFSDTLTRYIEHKNIKVFSLAKYCDLDRSTMYKILNGKRNPPSPEVFEKMTQFMHLTPIEYNFLKETLEITQVGPDTYYTRKSVEILSVSFRISLPPISQEVLSHRILYLSSARLTVFHWSLSNISTIMYIR